MAYPDICPSGTKDKGPKDQLCDVEAGPYGDSDILSTSHALQDGEYKEHEIGSCDVNETKYYTRLLEEYPLTPKEATNLEKFLGARPGSGRFILDTDATVPGVGCVWVKDKDQMAKKILDLKSDTGICEGLFEKDAGNKCGALKESLVAGYENHFKAEAPKTGGEKFVSSILTGLMYVGGALGGGLLAGFGFWGSARIGEHFFPNNDDPDPKTPSPGGGKKKSTPKTAPKSSANSVSAAPSAGNGAIENQAPVIIVDPSLSFNNPELDAVFKYQDPRNGIWEMDEEALRKLRMTPQEIARERELEEAEKEYQKFECKVAHCDGQLNAIDWMMIGAVGVAVAWWALPELAAAGGTAAAATETATAAAPVVAEIGSVPAWMSAGAAANDVVLPLSMAAGIGGFFSLPQSKEAPAGQ